MRVCYVTVMSVLTGSVLHIEPVGTRGTRRLRARLSATGAPTPDAREERCRHETNLQRVSAKHVRATQQSGRRRCQSPSCPDRIGVHACGDSSELIGNVNQHGGDVSLCRLVLTDHGQQSFAGYGRRR